MHIHSSWNPDRVAACCSNKRRETAVVRHPARMYAKFSGRALTVKSNRGALKFVHLYDADVSCARMSADTLEVELENGAVHLYTVKPPA